METIFLRRTTCLQIFHIITPAHNEALDAFPSLEEFFEVVKGMNPDSAAGPDGYNGFFYLTYWDIIKKDLYDAISEFFVGRELPKSWTSTLLLLVPKVQNPSSFKQLRPISLCNFSAKIITKV